MRTVAGIDAVLAVLVENGPPYDTRLVDLLLDRRRVLALEA